MRLRIFLTGALLLATVVSAALTTPPAGVYCGSTNSLAFQAVVGYPSINVTFSSQNGQTCTGFYSILVVKGLPFTAEQQQCYMARGFAFNSYTTSTGVLAVSGIFYGDSTTSTVALKSCPPALTNGTFCGMSSAGDLAVVTVGRPFNAYFSVPGVPVGFGFRSGAGTRPWAFTCTQDLGYTGSNVFMMNYCLGLTTLIATSTGLTLNGTYLGKTVTLALTTGNCGSAPPPGYYTGSIGQAGTALVVVTASRAARMISLATSAGAQTPQYTQPANTAFVVSGNFIMIDNSFSANPFNVTSLQYASNQFTVSYFNKTKLTATLTAGNAVNLPNTTYCGTDGNRTVMMTFSPSWDYARLQNFLVAVTNNGQLYCFANIQGVALLNGPLLISSASSSCLSYTNNLTISFSSSSTSATAVVVSIKATELTGPKWNFASLTNCTAQQPVPDTYCGSAGSSFAALNTASASGSSDAAISSGAAGATGTLQVSTAGRNCLWSNKVFVQPSSGKVFNNSLYPSCSFPFQVQSYAGGKFTINANGTSLVASQANCVKPTIANGTFCGSSGSTLVQLIVNTPFATGPAPISLSFGSTATGKFSTTMGQIDPAYATPSTVFVTALNSNIFVLETLRYQGSSWMLAGKHTTLGTLNLTLSASACVIVTNGNNNNNVVKSDDGVVRSSAIQAVCARSGSSQLVATQNLNFNWLMSNGTLRSCNLGTLNFIMGKGFYLTDAGTSSTSMQAAQCKPAPPQNVSAITITTNGNISLSLTSAGSTATQLTLNASTCMNSLTPTATYCGSLSGTAVAAAMGAKATVQFGTSCSYIGDVSGLISTNGSLLTTIAAASTNAASCPALKGITYKTAGSITVTFSTGSATLMQSSCQTIPDGVYCGSVGKNIVQLTQSQNGFYCTVSTSAQAANCNLQFTAVVTNGQLLLLPKYLCSASFNPTLKFTNGVISITLNGTAGSLANNTCALPSNGMFCGVDTVTKRQVILRISPGSVVNAFAGNTTGGALVGSRLYAQPATSTSFAIIVNGASTVLPFGNGAAFNFQVIAYPLGNVNASLSAASC